MTITYDEDHVISPVPEQLEDVEVGSTEALVLVKLVMLGTDVDVLESEIPGELIGVKSEVEARTDETGML